MSNSKIGLEILSGFKTKKGRTIYIDCAGLPDPITMGISFRYHNYDDVTLYFRIKAEGNPDWTFASPVNLGALGSGSDARYNWDNMGQRPNPNAELEETITLTLEAYTDSEYTDLKWTYSRIVTIKFIKSDDGSWTVDVLNDFDDGTVQGWSYDLYKDALLVSFDVASDYAISPPYSLKLKYKSDDYNELMWGCIYKSFTTPNKSEVFAIINVRMTSEESLRALEIKRDDTILALLGDKTWAKGDVIPRDKWIRVVVPLPANTTLTFKIILYVYFVDRGHLASIWLDDFKIISR